MDIEKIKAIIMFILALLNILAAYIVWRGGKNKATFHLGWCFFFYASLCFSWAAVYFPNSNKLFWSRAHWVGAFMLSAYYLIFVYYFTNHVKYIRLKIIFLNVTGILMSYMAIATPYFMTAVSPDYPYLNSETTGTLNILLGKPFVVLISCLGLYYLVRAYYKESGFKKWQIKYFIWGVLLSTIGPLIFSGIWPVFDRTVNPISNELTPYLSIFLVIFTAYAILKNNLFEIKLVLTELLTMLIGLVLFIQIFLTQGGQARIISSIIFLLYIIIGYLLIKSANQEIIKEEKTKKLAKELEELNLNLEKKVSKKTEELQNKIKELDESKKALLNILEDNTKAREEMEKEKNKTMAIIANFTDPIIVLDKHYKINIINPAASRVFGLSNADLDKQIATDNKFSISNFKSVIKKYYEIKEIKENTKEQIFINEEITIKENQRESTYKVITAKVLDINNEQIGVMKIFYDTTREKGIDKIKSEFISIAAHQLRTPLSAIKWGIKMVLEGDAGKLNAEQQELLNKGYISNERVIRLVNDLLNVSRIEEGRFGFNFEISDFKEVLDIAISNIDSLVAKNHQELNVEIPTGLPKISLDKERMVMVMQNLLSNAINYTPEYGKIQILAEIDKQSLHVKIKDQGVGIPDTDQPKLFSKFFRAANAIKLETEGSGLGLFLVKNIIEKHNGTISLKSEEGKGTEVDFFIPIVGNI
ncbi:MAG: ATP-binding protein [Candidatus Paceibacterota bacterium]